MAVTKNQLHFAKRRGLAANVPQHVFRQCHFGQTVQFSDNAFGVQTHRHGSVEGGIGNAVLVNELGSREWLRDCSQKIGSL